MVGGGAAASGNAVAFQGVGSDAWVISKTLTIGKPTGSYPGALLVATVCSDTYITSLTSSGWTVAEKSARTSDFAVYVLYKIEDGGDPETFTFTANTSADMGGYVARYTKTGGTWAITDTSEFGYLSSVSPQSFGTVTATGPGIVHWVYGSDDYAAGIRYMSAGPVGATLIAGRQSATSAEVHMWYQAVESSGNVDNTVAHVGTVMSSQIAVLIEAQ